MAASVRDNRVGSIAYLGLGSNLGDRTEALRRTVEALISCRGIFLDRTKDVAPVYETSPIDAPPHSAPFLNTVIRVRTTLDPKTLLETCLTLEARQGRLRSTPNAPRSIDIDLLFFDNLVSDDPALILPHPRLHERCFVLEPLRDLAPELIHPVHGETIAALAAAARRRFPNQRIEPYHEESRIGARSLSSPGTHFAR